MGASQLLLSKLKNRKRKARTRQAPSIRCTQSQDVSDRLLCRERKQSLRFRPSDKVLKEIRHYQSTCKNVLPKRSFQNVVKGIATKSCPGFKFQAQAIAALQEATEAYLTTLMEDSNLFALHAGRVTVTVRDMRLARRFRRETS